ncbi:CAD protein [Hypsibius exemplaris]|uniref:CAD protein n=1 Tax=Hypsibius exemplaris TaxID=2072580 RepID=A0A1W0WL04_HYPEX|nr:CAD protein [Hypsibius exemplaris]
MSTATLVLEDNGSVFRGRVFGAQRDVEGEVVFQTGMVGYPESLTDPSYHSQILVLTYPMIGNYGVPGEEVDEHGIEKWLESARVWPVGLIVGNLSKEYSHWNAGRSLADWLVKYNVPGIEGVDTRALTMLLRERKTLRGKIIMGDAIPQHLTFSVDVVANLVAEVSRKESSPVMNPTGSVKILVIDCGLKNNQLRCFLQRGACVQVVPWNYSFQPLMRQYDGLFISNGPGDPEQCGQLIANLTAYMKSPDMKPIFGICMGHQIIALAAGMRSAKMPYGHRGHNQPCLLAGTQRCFITSQNHGYEIDTSVLPIGWEELFRNANDDTNEGLISLVKPIFSVQFHPEHMAGPADLECLFDVFLDSVNQFKRRTPFDLKAMIMQKLDPHPVDNAPAKPKKVLILGSGGLSIGQAGEFDYAGSQGIKALVEEGITVVLINPNIATVQTSKGLASKVYFLPITPEYVLQVIEAERPDGILLNFGGQTALNCGVELFRQGVFSNDKLPVSVLGTPVEVIINTEDRKLFAEKLAQINYEVAPGRTAETVTDALAAAEELGYPVLVRTEFALGGLGSGFAHTAEQMAELAKKALNGPGKILIDKSLSGWKEVEYEVVRDMYDNCITVCNMENVDPLGIHTGESVVVAPSQTLTDEEYHLLRTAAIEIIRHLGVVGECNIQYALDPSSKKFYVVEVNARLSRSSALASKATGYPLAYIAAKLSIGYSLPELRNAVTKKTTACFEPSLDYVVVKIPRWDLNKFSRVSNKIGSSMKSIGEVMAIGRTFEEAFQKALRMVDEHVTGFDPSQETVCVETLTNPTDKRMLVLAAALSKDYSIDEIHKLTNIDKWFLSRMKNITDYARQLRTNSMAGRNASEKDLSKRLSADEILTAKRLGFSDKQISQCVRSTEQAVRDLRKKLEIRPWVKQIDTVAGEWPAETNYLYLTYHGDHHDVAFPADQSAVMVLGSGVYRIGSSVEFDCCAVGCLDELRRCGRKTIMINCNPETVSTDYDKCDRLYFEEISLECVMEIYELESPAGVILSMGGQLPNNIALDLMHLSKLKILGTSAESIDKAEDRFKFSRMMDQLQREHPEITQPKWKMLTDLKAAQQFCLDVGYPCLIRPSYVLSGAAMSVAQSPEDLVEYLDKATKVSNDHPVVISKFIEDAKEIDVDAVACNGELVCMAVSEHVENAGVHSGDATLVTPPQDLTEKTLGKIETIVTVIGKSLKVNGPYNLQLIAKDDELKVIECNLRVSRSFPFVSKTLDYDFVAAATRVALGERVPPVGMLMGTDRRVGVKAPMFSFSRLTDADVNLGVEMCSTGEVACYGVNRNEAFLKAMISTGFRYPKQNIFLSVGSQKHKEELQNGVKSLQAMGYRLYGSNGTAEFYRQRGIPVETTLWPEPDIPLGNGDATRNSRNGSPDGALKSFDLVINIPLRKSGARRASSVFISTNGTRGYKTRRTAVDLSTPLITDIKVAKLLIVSIELYRTPPPLRRAVDCVTSRRLERLPGLIDVHVHLREPGATHKEDFDSGTAAALAGGVTLVCCMPNTTPSVVDKTTLALSQKCAAAGARCDYALFVGASADNAVAVAKLAPQAAALKMYLNCTFSTLELSDTTLWGPHFQHWPKDKLICVHAEGHTLAAVLFFVQLYQRKVHICHVSKREEILLIKQAKAQGLPVTCEVAPHHLFLSEKDLPALAGRGGVKPPLATEDDQAALWANMDTIDCFATDHAPHLPAEKDGEKSPPGYPGLETMLPLLLTAVHEGRLRVQDIIEKLHDNPKRIFDLPDQPDTYLEVDMDEVWTIPTETVHSRAKWTPFAGRRVRGKVHRVVLHGEDAYVEGIVVAKRGSGNDVRSAAYLDSLATAHVEIHPRKAASVADVEHQPHQNGWANHNGHAMDSNIGDGDAGVARKTLSAQRSTTTSRVARNVSSSLDWHSDPPRTASPILGGGESITLPSHIVSVSQFSKGMVDHICSVAERIKGDIKSSRPIAPILKGKVMASMFYEVSTRTMNSFAAAMQRLGGSVIYLDPQSSSVQKGESLEDSITCMAGYSDLLVMRHPEPGAAARASRRLGSMPFINAGDGTGEHPTQALLDVFTIRDEFGSVKGLTITMVGDLKHGRTVHSLAKLLTLYHVKEIRYIFPTGLGMPEEVRKFVKSKGIHQEDYPSLEAALPDTHVLYMTRIQKERFASDEEYQASCGKFVLTPELMTLALPESREGRKMRVLHPLPRLTELSTELDTDSRAAYFRQAENGLYVRMALLGMLVHGKDAFGRDY